MGAIVYGGLPSLVKKLYIREGNSFQVLLVIYRNKVQEDLTGATITALNLIGPAGTTAIVNKVISGNLIRVPITPAIASALGSYSFDLKYTIPDAEFASGVRECALDAYSFDIVPTSAQASDIDEFAIPADVATGFRGAAFTFEMFTPEQIEILQKPAKDIAATISLNEVVRIHAEEARVTAEQQREIAEGERDLAETARESAETNRNTEEGKRATAESSRVTEEGKRVTAETARVTAEGDATKGRVKAENDRVTAENTRQIKETERQQAETARANAEGDATKGRVKAEADRVAAEALRVTAESGRAAELATKAAHGYTAPAVPKTLKQVDDSVLQLAGEVSLLDAVQGAKIKDIENVLSTANLGQSTQVSVSGRKVVSLPKNAANGGMQVKLEGLTAENLVINGDFRNGTTGWIALGANLSVSGNNLLVTGNGAQSTVRVGTMLSPANSGDKLYVKVQVRNDSANASSFSIILREGVSTGLIYANTNAMPLSAGGIIGSSYILTMNQQAPSLYLLINNLFSDAAAANGAVIFVGPGGVKTLNLTTIFGAGNEPTKEQCDIIFSNYFEGKKNFEATGRIRSVDKNGLNPTALYLTAPELRSNGTVKDEVRKGANGYELVKRISSVDGTVLATPITSPISYGGILNSSESGTVYHEPIIADAGVYGTKMDILLTDYPISTLEEIIKHVDGFDTYLNVANAVIAGDKLSFTHPDLASGDLVLFTYAFDKESTNSNITATFYDSNVVKIDTVTGKAYRINEVVTNGVLTRTLTEV